jgi:L-asparaginase
MARPRVAVIFTGGTIAMRADTGLGGNVPSLDADALLASVPGVDELADVVPIDWGLVPASHLSFAQVLEIGGILRDQLAQPDVSGAVVVQGTDVIEETAFAWDLLPLPDKPIVVVGAMRSASEDGYDGPGNLRGAIAGAADRALGGQGVVVAMAGEIHGADDVRKTHTHATDTFRSPNRGRLGTVADGQVTLERRRSPARLRRIPTRAALPVHLLPFALETEPAVFASLAEPRPAGLVVAAAGGGNTPPAFLALGRRLIDAGVPVALTTRCPSGQARSGYAFEGGSSQWWEAGALFTGTLDAYRARVLLALGLGAGAALAELTSICEAYGGGRAS